MLVRAARLNLRRYSTALQTTDLLEKYRGLVAAGQIQYDEDQVRVVMQLRRLQRELIDYTPAMVAPRLLENPETSSAWYADDSSETQHDSLSLIALKSHSEELASLNTPKGMLLTGPPGCGKSFLIDLWLSCVPTPYKARKHYSQLVLEIYRGVWQETQRRMVGTPPSEPTRSAWDASLRTKWRELVQAGNLPKIWPRNNNPPPSASPSIAFSVARKLLLRHWLLVFDEVQLLDISSATLLADVLSWYWRMGGVIVGTSNKVPDDIYKHGVQRERLEPFVEALKIRCPVLTLRTERDWRKRDDEGLGRTWLLAGQEAQFEEALKTFSGVESVQQNRTITVFGRALPIPWSSGGVTSFTFDQLCDASLGAADYLTLAAHFHTIGITDIPTLTLASKNQARRFISLIDALYEARCRLVCIAETRPEEMFFPDAVAGDSELAVDALHAESVSETREGYRPNVAAYDAPQMQRPDEHMRQQSVALDTLAIFSGQEEQFAFKRALSRLIEMTSASYSRSAQWMPLGDEDRAWERTSKLAAATGTSISATTSQPAFAQPTAPRLKADHVWGVRDDWGKGADRWGLGARAHEPKPQSKSE
ncbi:Mitochondrial ATPase [Mycena chlorophos]|uniref:Mitochondrial ATPase n=1 Tax=Mycena chlorophos TaxID=658473 RepID=A0A8H6W4Z6_MYCCL|nr:Mitochondrial ATPase [Mycena chlorophos]